MARISDTREQIMDRAAHLLMSRGFNGFSYADISSHLGVKNAAVHYHFPAKSDLALALIDDYRKILRKNTAEFMAYGGSTLPQVEGLFAFTSKQCQLGRCICPFGAFSVDYTDLPEDVRQEMQRFMDETINWLTQVLEVGRKQQELEFTGKPGPKALSILATLQGARQMARIHGFDLLDDVIGQIRSELNIDT
ncbi:MAG: TetR/AcrR family transcriptional regulator [Gammaproteobacteria bacterium]|nr:TetR/AcrR family transcriptional regulator [Gammaproteobacteria bacterium]